ncbi:MAG: hypothetical protein JW795_00505 [Chitinivibrionales bacterium]|nr:hypothetical protein [Chitinivibrionales bacterium]
MSRTALLGIKPVLFFFACIMAVMNGACGQIGIIVNKHLWPYVQQSIIAYSRDLQNIENKTVWLDASSYDEMSDALSLRNALIQRYRTADLEGVVLIGDFPIVRFRDGKTFFPTDYYYMDLDGDWTGGSGYNFTTHSGLRQMEIWVSRISASVLEPELGTEEAIVSSYFGRLHNRMMGLDTLKRSYCIFGNVNEWPTLEEENKNGLDYAASAVDTYKRPVDSKANWKKVLTRGYEYTLLYEHSTESCHSFNDSLFYFADFLSTPAQGRFYNLFACAISNYLKKNLGGFYALSHGGLISIGSTKNGSMIMGSFHYYNEPLARGESFGEAFKKWSNAAGIQNPQWHYGMTLQGAGSLRLQPYPRTPMTKLPKLVSGSIRVYPTIVSCRGKIFCTSMKTSVHSSSFHAEFYSTQGVRILDVTQHEFPLTLDLALSTHRTLAAGTYILHVKECKQGSDFRTLLTTKVTVF